MATKKSTFEKLSTINVAKYTEKKGKFTYLSWAWAWSELMKRFPDSFRTVYENENTGLPYFKDTNGIMVKVGVTIEGQEHIIYQPVMDNRNNAMKPEQATMRDINDTIQRATVKAIALHGLGLYLYAGEDLPDMSLLPHHDSWETERGKFCAQIGKLGKTYDEVADWCEKLNRPRPSQMNPSQRSKLLAYLKNQNSESSSS